METILEKYIPFFVKDSPYLKSLLSNGPFPELGIEVPAGCAKTDLNIRCMNDLVGLLRTARFWIVPDVLETSPDLLPRIESNCLEKTRIIGNSLLTFRKIYFRCLLCPAQSHINTMPHIEH